MKAHGNVEEVAQAQPLAYNITALAKETSLSRSLIYEHIKDGLLKVTKVGRRTIILREDAKNWLASL